MSLELFWLLGLLAMGIVIALISLSYKVRTTADSAIAKGIVIWGCAIVTAWIFGGTLFVLVARGLVK